MQNVIPSLNKFFFNN